MKKNLYTSSVVVVFLFLFNQSFAQFSDFAATGYGSANLFPGGALMGFGGRAEFVFSGFGKHSRGGDDQNSLFLGVTAGFGSSHQSDYYYPPGGGGSVDANVTYKMTLIDIYLGGKRYFGDGGLGDGGFYGMGDAGLVIIPTKKTYDDYPFLGETDETLSDLLIGFGVGYEADLNFGMLFGEAKLAITSSGISSREGTDSPIGLMLSINAGVRFPFGK